MTEVVPSLQALRVFLGILISPVRVTPSLALRRTLDVMAMLLLFMSME
jgi:hypothetical protein